MWVEWELIDFSGYGSLKGRPSASVLNEYPLTIPKLSASSHFTNDLGLDSLDTVEVVMAIEEVGATTMKTKSTF